MFNQHINMQPPHDATDKEGQEAAFASGVNTLFDAGTPCKALQTRNLRNGMLSFHPGQALEMDDKQNFGPSHSYSEFGDPGPGLEVMFHGNKDASLFTSSSSSPLHHIYNKNSPSSSSEPRHHELNNPRASIRKHRAHLDLMHSPGNASLDMAYQSSWANRFQAFNIQAHDYQIALPPTSPLKPEPSENIARLTEGESSLQNNHHDAESTYSQSPMVNHSRHTPISGPCTDQGMRHIYVDQQRPATSASPISPPSHHIIRSQHSELSAMSSWNSESIDAPSFHYSTDLQTPDGQTWWQAPEATNRDLHSYSQSPYQPMVVAPTAQKPPTHQTRVLQGTSMMHMGQSTGIGSVREPPFPPSAVSCPEDMACAPFTPLAPAHDAISRNSPLETSNQRQYAPPSHSHPVSLASIKSPGLPLRSTSANPTHGLLKAKPEIRPHDKHQHQRKSHIRKTSGISTHSQRSIKGTPITPNSNTNPIIKRPLSVSFVNFTPEDSQKLLTGVAPSGSSKTKARREQEAREKRRKLSEAALLAVKRAGGDVEAFEAVFC
ncbi:Wet1-IV [Histoplasma capsulatum var. duboisii H88]|uniref:Developmental regulatory protein wetA n=3 Tax=Ajellomyces capsulatus TaxID=5037 RepID=A0A8A1LCN4_AJEC8|nr:Wet1-IV [Histoplasma capsulatum var. duboisii H88]